MQVVVLLCILAASLRWTDAVNNRYLPKNFKIGAANCAPQIEGGWNDDGKGGTIWDHYAHTHPERIVDRSGPDMASDEYHHYKEDIALVKATGLDTYRLSIAWSRILPTGHTDKVNQAGVQYYKNVFAALKAVNVEPLVTLYHWDLPQPLQDEYNGWLGDQVVDDFAAYARLCFELFNDDVKLWTTINEPKQVCQGGYGVGVLAPGIHSDGVGDYVCSRNVLLAHAKAYHIYDKEFRAKNKGRIAMVIDTSWFEPGSNSAADRDAAERIRQFTFGLYANPIYHGNWPQVVIDRVAHRSQLEGFSKSRLPAFSKEEIALIKGTHDFLPLNHYISFMANATGESAIGDPSAGRDISVWTMRYPTISPWGLRNLLVWLKKTYGDVEILITENGASDKTGDLEDDHRLIYYREFLSACLDAYYEDGVNVSAYYAWSIFDDWEWNDGFTVFPGMYRVDFSSPKRTRTPRKSSRWYKNMSTTRCLVDKCV